MKRRWGEKSRSSGGGLQRPALRAFLLTAGFLVLWAAPALAADCTSPAAPEGSIVYGTSDHVLAFCNGTGWVSVGGGGGGAADNLGDHTATTDLDLATNKIVNLAAPTAAGDAVTKAYADALGGADNLGNHTAAANLVMGSYWLSGDGGNEGLSVNASGNVGIGTASPAEKLEVSGNVKLSGGSPTYKITNVASPTASSDVATKAYVDAAGGGAIALHGVGSAPPCPSGWTEVVPQTAAGSFLTNTSGPGAFAATPAGATYHSSYQPGQVATTVSAHGYTTYTFYYRVCKQ